MAEPKCPDCGVSGMNHIVSAESSEHSKKMEAWFYIAHCDACGHVYGLFTKHQFTASATAINGPKLVLPPRD